MSQSARPNRTGRHSSGARPRRLLAAALAALLCSGAGGGAPADPKVDSGWTVGTPATAIVEVPQPGAQVQTILQNVLEQTHEPTIRVLGPPTSHPTNGSLRVAERPSVPESWRASGLHVSPLMTTVPSRAGARSAASAELPLTLGQPAAPPTTKTSGSTVVITIPPQAETEAADQSAEEIESGCDGDAFAPAGDDAATRDETAPEDDEPADGVAVVPADEAECESVEDAPDDIAVDAGETVLVVPESEAEPDEAAPAATLPAEKAGNPQRTEEDSNAAEREQSRPEDSSGQSATAGQRPSMPLVEVVPPPPLTRQLVNLRGRVRSVLKGYYRKPLNSRDHDCWEVMHGMLSYGIHSRILQGSARGEPITAVGWLCYNKPCKGLTLMYVTPQGELRAKWGVGLQGHSGQLLAMLAQCRVSPDYPIHVGKHAFTINDLIEAEKKTCYPKSELTFKLLAFQQYLDLNEKWVNDQGLDWDIPRLIREEIAQPIRGAACGGTHRLSALSLTVKARERRGEPLDGQYAEAAAFVEKYQKYAFRLQNRDGSLSTEWFRGRGEEDDKDRRIKTTGHILEWLCYSLRDEQLREPQTVRAVAYLANLMYSNYDHEWEVGPRSHALHALLLYDERVFKPFDKEGEVASYRPTRSTAKRPQPRPSSSRR